MKLPPSKAALSSSDLDDLDGASRRAEKKPRRAVNIARVPTRRWDDKAQDDGLVRDVRIKPRDTIDLEAQCQVFGGSGRSALDSSRIVGWVAESMLLFGFCDRRSIGQKWPDLGGKNSQQVPAA